MLEVASARSIRCPSLTRRAAAETFQPAAIGRHRAATHQPDRARIERLHRGNKLRPETGAGCRLLTQIGIVDIDVGTRLCTAVGDAPGERQRLFALSARPAGVTASKVKYVLMPVAVVGQGESVTHVHAASSDQRDTNLRRAA